MLCPEGNSELNRFDVDCNVCGWERPVKEQEDWIAIGLISSQVFAELARETLEQIGIPAVLLSRSGIFGAMGLTLNPWSGKTSGAYELSVPVAFAREAIDTLEMTLGDNFLKIES
ncbi:MAG TPA: hypothetical protein PLF13_11245 [candidate division Zixibacteria bacterium]|nr:hypothetical protein [candidate division Zixibacteria bacterium]